MRKTSTLDPLLSRSVQQILTAILLERDEPWYLSDLARRLRRTPSTLQKPLNSLLKAGIIRRWSDGNRVYFAKDPDCPYLQELRGLLSKTVGLVDVLREVLAPLAGKIRLAFVFGSVARGQESSRSDVDLLVLGSVTLSVLAPHLEVAEKRLGRPVNATIFQPKEFADLIARKNHFLHTVLRSDKLSVIGATHDLEELTKTKASRAARYQQSGA